MTEKLLIRNSVSADVAAIEAIYPDAFPEEDLLHINSMREHDFGLVAASIWAAV